MRSKRKKCVLENINKLESRECIGFHQSDFHREIIMV